MKRNADRHSHHWNDDDGGDDDDDQEDKYDQGPQRSSGHGTNQRGSEPNARGSSTTIPKWAAGAKLAKTDAPLLPGGDVVGGGMVWIDLSSWQTAGCWVPGGVHGVCPYKAADNTVALQEIIKVSAIGECLKVFLCVEAIVSLDHVFSYIFCDFVK